MVNRTALISALVVGSLLLILAFVLFFSNSQTQTGSATNPTSEKHGVEFHNPILNRTGEHVQKNSSVTLVTSAIALNEVLVNSVKGSQIELAEGVYIGQFKVEQDDLVIRGQGPETIIKLDAHGTSKAPTIALNISANNCQLSKIKFVSYFNHTHGIVINGTRTIVSEIHLEGFDHALLSYSEDNKLSNISIKDSSIGIYIHANRSYLNSIKMENISRHGAVISGANNTLDCFTCNSCEKGVYIDGNYNVVQNVETRRPKNPDMFSGIFVGSGVGNVVDSYSGPEDGVTLGPYSSNSELRSSVSKDVHVMGNWHSLFNVDAGKLLWIHGNGHQIDNWKAMELKNHGTNVTLT